MVDTKTAVRTGAPLWQHLSVALPAYALVVILAVLLLNLPGAADYIGSDNDDTMRLVEVRDLLAGQGWFDLLQRRLGLEGGTLMHWSRLIDLPIAALIAFFRLFTEPQRAEALAVTVWPLALIVPMLAAMGLAGKRIGGPQAMHVALVLTALLIVTNNRFLPGAIDHHNVQLVLVATMAAMIVDPRNRAASFAIAGLAAAVAIAIGAETTPLVTAVCLAVAVAWAWHGQAFAPAAKAFSITITLAISALFFATVPPHLYAVVTCDSLSLGYYGLASIGGALLFLSVLLASNRGRGTRMAVLAVDGAIILGTALVLAPECLRNPLSDLDPLLVSLWLDHVTEAQSFMGELRLEPALVGGFYIPGFAAIAVCVFRILGRDRVHLHAILLSLLLVSWGIALIQVRGAVFANLLSIIPLSLLISELRSNANRDPENLSASFAFLVGVLVAVPSFWAFAGVMTTQGTAGLINRMKSVSTAEIGTSSDCTSQAAMRQLAGLQPGVVVAPSDSGSPILRFTAHRVLSAPYHRNQGGMLTELHVGLSQPDEAVAFLRGSAVTVLAFCPSDPQTARIIETKPDGLYAALKRSDVPAYLEPLPADPNSGFSVFEVRLPDGK